MAKDEALEGNTSSLDLTTSNMSLIPDKTTSQI
jgi:hypothetical protein